MSNRLRIQEAGASYHVNLKAVTGVRAFPDSYHRSRFIDFLAGEISKSEWICLGYAILGTHFHLVIRLREVTLSTGFQRLNSTYSRWFNRKHGRTGALWQARFYDVLIESDFQLLETQRYLALNAVRAGLAERPEDWPYCHYGACIGAHPPDPIVDEDAILRLLSRDRTRARQLLNAYVEEPDVRVRRQTFLRARSERAQTPKTRTAKPAKR